MKSKPTARYFISMERGDIGLLDFSDPRNANYLWDKIAESYFELKYMVSAGQHKFVLNNDISTGWCDTLYIAKLTIRIRIKQIAFKLLDSALKTNQKVKYGC